MLNSPHRKLAASLAPLLFAIACAHHVDLRPNKPVGADVAQTLVLTNDTANALTIMPALTGSAKPPLIVQPAQQTTLRFTIRLEENVSAGREREVVLVPESSDYVTQSAIDLLMKARFGNGPAREIRVRLGKCLFDSSQSATHDLHLKKPPLSGVPALQLCP
jgi:hypothetical protein